MAETAFINTGIYQSSNSDSAVVPKPVDTAEGDIMFALLSRYNSAEEPNSAPEGWTKLGSEPYIIYYYVLYYKVAGAAEPDTYTWGWAAANRVKVTIATYRGGFDTNDPIDAFSNTQYIESNKIARAASMNVTAVNSNLIFAASVFSLSSKTFTKPATQDDDWVEDYDAGSVDPDMWQTFDHCNWSGSGASGVIDATISVASGAKHAFAVALNVGGAPPAEYIPKVIMF